MPIGIQGAMLRDGILAFWPRTLYTRAEHQSSFNCPVRGESWWQDQSR